MYKLIVISGFGLSVCLLVAGCGDSSRSVNPVQPLQVSDFPLEVGTHWVYHVVDTLTADEDTIDVFITGEEDRANGERLTTWAFVSRSSVFDYGIQYVVVQGDTIWFYSDTSMVAYQKLVFPITSGKEWGHVYGASLVLEQQTLKTQIGTFRAYPVDTKLRSIAENVIWESTLWLVKDIGLAQVTRVSGYFIISSVRIWHLIEFEPSPELPGP